MLVEIMSEETDVLDNAKADMDYWCKFPSQWRNEALTAKKMRDMDK